MDEKMNELKSEHQLLDPDEMYAWLEDRLRGIGHPMDIERIRAAYEMAKRGHEGQKRKDGSPYLTHCVATAEIAVDFGLDEDSIVAALLHDTIEDTAITHDDIEKQFGAAVADIVDGVTKLTRVQYTSKEDEQMENLRKMLMAMAKDIRVILIKIADRLHNMRTMDYQSPEKQRSKSLETMEIYAPLAHRLGMQRAKWELEDLSLQYLDPSGYQEITHTLDKKMPELEAFMVSIKNQIQRRMDEEQIHVEQFEPYEKTYTVSTYDALQAILAYLDATRQDTLHAETRIMIKPSYTFHVVDQLITNFHQPQSTLLLLVSAFVGGDWRTIYDYALGHGFRFLSYGDSSILSRK